MPCSTPSPDSPPLLSTISGLPGSGTTTVSRLVADALGLERVPGGEVFRQLAAEADMSLAEFGAYAAAHPEIDIELDRRLTERARLGGCIIESRLAGWLVTRASLRAVRGWVDCDSAEEHTYELQSLMRIRYAV